MRMRARWRRMLFTYCRGVAHEYMKLHRKRHPIFLISTEIGKLRAESGIERLTPPAYPKWTLMQDYQKKVTARNPLPLKAYGRGFCGGATEPSSILLSNC